MMNFNRKQGFTLLEVSVTVTLLVMTMGLAMSGYMFLLKNVNQGDVQNELDIDVQLAMQRLKKDLRLSSLDDMFYYPAGSGPYEAISFPLASSLGSDGILEKDADGKLLWNLTIIYHIRPTTPNQLVKTTFTSRNNSLTDAQRQEQLESVVADGDGEGTYNGGNASSQVIFENLLDWEINPKAGYYDAYAPTITRDSTSLGYVLLDPGTHEFTFRVVDKNSGSSGYKIGIDQLFVSPSHSAREAEAQLPVSAESGATAITQYMPSGSWKGNHQLYFPATSVGDSFTLELDNDRWEETNFDGIGYQASNTTVKFETTLSPSDYVVQLAGMDTAWEAAIQTGDSEGQNTAQGHMANWAIRTVIKGADLADNGNWIDYGGEKCKVSFAGSETATFAMYNAYIGESASSTNIDMNYRDLSKVYPIKFGADPYELFGAGFPPSESNWIDLPIDQNKNYVISYSLFNVSSWNAPKQWLDTRVALTDTATWSTWVAEDAGDGILNNQNWGGQGFPAYPTNRIFGLHSLKVSYPESGAYTSQIFDTHLTQPQYGDISWNVAAMPEGVEAPLSLKVRSSDLSDLSDAAEWSAITASTLNAHSVGASYNRYIQFQAYLESDATSMHTPKLKDVTIDWAGERQLVAVGGIFTKGPDYGLFEISVDGAPLSAALIVDLKIYKDVAAMNNKSRQITSSLQVELTPRNSGL